MTFKSNNPLDALKKRKKELESKLQESLRDKLTKVKKDSIESISNKVPFHVPNINFDHLKDQFNQIKQESNLSDSVFNSSKPSLNNSLLGSSSDFVEGTENILNTVRDESTDRVNSVLNTLKNADNTSYTNITNNVVGDNNYGNLNERDNVDKKDIPQRSPRRNLVLGKISSFFHKKDLEILQSFISKKEVFVDDFIKALDIKSDILDRQISKLININKSSLGYLDENSDLIGDCFLNIKNHFNNGGSLYFGGVLDSDGFSDYEVNKSRVYTTKDLDTTAVTRALYFFKLPFKLQLSKFNNFQFHILFLINYYFANRKIKELLTITKEDSNYSKSKDFLLSVNENLKIYLNIKSDE